MNSEPYRGASERGAALGLLAAFKLLNDHSGARARQVAAIWCRKKVVAFCREMPDVCDAKRPLTILSTLESVADGQFQARCTLRLVSGFDQF